MIPIVIFPGTKVSGVATMSDIMFLAKKEFDGKLKKNEKFLSATGTLATLTASSGKDLYIARAKVIFYANATTASSAAVDKVELQINGLVVETAIMTFDGQSNDSGIMTFGYEFKNVGHKVAAAQVIKLEVITLDADTDVEGFIECFEETTGATPVI